MCKRVLLLGVVVSLCVAAGPAAKALAERKVYDTTWESLDSRPVPKWFNEAKFGIFIVWGPYSVPGWAPVGAYAEWYGHRAWQKRKGYWDFYKKNYGEKFNYRQFGEKMTAAKWDPDKWAKLFADAGAKYVAFCAKYHDGYCLWANTQNRALKGKTFKLDKKYADVRDLYANGWNSVDTGPKRDLTAEMAAAVKKVGIRMGVYYSLYEWWNPLWLTDRKKYVEEYYFPQFKELVTKYKPQFIFADGEWSAGEDVWRPKEMMAWLFNESPVRDTIVTNDRFGAMRRKHGPVYSSEYGGGNFPPAHAWQEDRGIGRSYGYNRNETVKQYNSRRDLLNMLTKVAGNGGNLLLCVGPLPDGTIPALQKQRLREMGQWLKANGEAIYGTTASPFWPRKFAWGTVTARPGKLYLHVYGRPADPLELHGLTGNITAAYLLADKAKTPIKLHGGLDGVTVPLPAKLPDKDVSVIALEYKGKLAIDNTVRPRPDGSVFLSYVQAKIYGKTPRMESRQIGYWNDPKDSVGWTFHLNKPGEYSVSIIYSCNKGAGGSAFTVTHAGTSLSAVTRETGSWRKHGKHELGRITFTKAGKHTLRVKPKTPPPWKSMGLNSITLKPARAVSK